jgi:hypothetical protein
MKEGIMIRQFINEAKVQEVNERHTLSNRLRMENRNMRTETEYFLMI